MAPGAAATHDGTTADAAATVLLLEDDPLVAAFVVAALAGAGCTVRHAGDLAAARRLAGGGERLWLFDAHLPDGASADLLRELRAAGRRTPAIALTGDDTAGTARRLREAGFARVLGKPLATARLREVVLAALEGHAVAVAAPARPRTAGADAAAGGAGWDDAAATRALGDAAVVPALRRLFLDELPAHCRGVRAACAAGDADALHACLHRLQAGCRFVGATALLASVQRLAASPSDADALARFQAEATALLRPAADALSPAAG